MLVDADHAVLAIAGILELVTLVTFLLRGILPILSAELREGLAASRARLVVLCVALLRDAIDDLVSSIRVLAPLAHLPAAHRFFGLPPRRLRCSVEGVAAGCYEES